MRKCDEPNSKESGRYIVYHLTEKWDGGTLAKVLKELSVSDPSQSISWGQVRKWIAQRHVEINGNLCLDEARRVRTGDVIKFWLQSRPLPVGVNDIRLAYSDPHLCVVEKPAGVTSVRHAREGGLTNARRQLQPTLDELVAEVLSRHQGPDGPQGLEERTPKASQRAASRPFVSRERKRQESRSRQPSASISRFRVFPVHRLDHHTSGLMLFARTRETEQKLISMFRRHQVQREYVGVCHGTLQPQTIRSFLVRNRGDGLRGSLPAQSSPELLKDAQEAITHVIGSKPIGQGHYSLFRCRLETGRTHQIRIHLSELGHRLCGEPVYVFNSEGRRLDDQSGAPRQALHSDRLALVHPITAQPLRLEMPWPQDLAKWIRTLADEANATEGSSA